MSLSVPTTSDLSEQIASDIGASLGQTIPILPKAFVRVLAKVLAAVFVLLFKYASWMALQMFVAHASFRETTVNGRKLVPLIEWGRLIGVGDPDPATRAELWVTATVLAVDANKSIPAGHQLVRTETGFVYSVVAPVALGSSTVSVRVRATASPNGGDGSGATGNLLPGDVIEFANSPPGVATKAVVASQAVTADDAETADRYRGRIVAHMRARPQGGAHADYREWALTVPGIVACYPYAGELPGGSGPGIVDIYVEASEESSGSTDGIPTTPQRDAVLAAINYDVGGKATRRPVSAAPMVLPISRASFAFEIGGLDPDTPETRDRIEAGLSEYLLSREPYIEGLSSLPRRDRVTLPAAAGIVDQIVSAQGATVTYVNMTPGPAITLAHGQKAKIAGTPTYS